MEGQHEEQMVAGFLFSPSKKHVCLIRKLRPKWQKGLLNAVGGRVESGEMPIPAMRREFLEETGIIVDEWHPFVDMVGLKWGVLFFMAVAQSAQDCKTITRTNEEVRWFPVYHLPQNVIPNLRWLIPLALDNANGLVKPVQISYSE